MSQRQSSSSPTWQSETVPERLPVGPMGWLRVAIKGLILLVLIFGGLVLMLALRIVERPLCGAARPVTPFITQGVCRGALLVIGLRYRIIGTPMQRSGAIVANHSSWLDIFALNARKRIYFVSKSEVADWPGIGWLARATGTLFIARDRREATEQVQVMQRRLAAGHKLVFFPEGTSTDGQRVLDFKPTLFAAFMTPDLRPLLWVQPVTVIYQAPKGLDPRVYGWWGGMDFGPHLVSLLAMAAHGQVTVRYHAPVRAADVTDRKALATVTGQAVRQGLTDAGVTAD